MDDKREITKPLGNQTSDVLMWKDTLRSPKLARKGGYSTDMPTHSSLKRSGSASNLRKSTGSLAANFTGTGSLKNTTSDLTRIESEYIKNLQQQVYFLELEANYLEQTKRASEMQPQITSEAERMLHKLRQMQGEVDGLHLEIKRKGSNVNMLTTEKERLVSRLSSEEDSHQREKRLLLDEVVTLKKEKDLLDREGNRKDSQILMAREDVEKTASLLRNAEQKISMLKNQLDQKNDQHKITQSALDEKRNELLKTETQLREIEDKYYSSTITIQDKLVQDLRDEIRILRQKLKETELHADQDRLLRTKLSDDSSHLVKENASLNQQVIEMSKQLERERSLRETNDTRRSQNISELVLVKEKEKQHKYELDQAKEMLKHEQDRVKHYMEQVAQQEQLATSTGLNASTSRSKLAEVEAQYKNVETDYSQMKRDKMLLVDHVADLQTQLDGKDKEIIGLQAHIHHIETRLKELEHLKGIESSLQSQKWDEFSRLAESMKSLSRTMARSTSPGPSSRVLEYSMQ